MSRRSLETDARVARALRGLGWNGRGLAEPWLRDHVRRTLAHWMEEAGIVARRLDEVVRVAADRLKVRVVEIQSDDELRGLVHSYCAKEEFAFASLPAEFSGDVEAAIVRLKNAAPWERPFVAVVDARRERSAARYFGSCHEVAHPFLEPQLSFSFRCRAGSIESIEKATDIVAGEVAFYQPLALPALQSHAGNDLTYAAMESFWTQEAPFASRSAAFVAATRLWSQPTLLLMAEMRRARHGRDGGIPALRVVMAVPNDAARRERLHVPPFRVPPESLISQAYRDPWQGVHEGTENLGSWRASNGSVLPARMVRLGARRAGAKVVAVLRA